MLSLLNIIEHAVENTVNPNDANEEMMKITNITSLENIVNLDEIYEDNNIDDKNNLSDSTKNHTPEKTNNVLLPGTSTIKNEAKIPFYYFLLEMFPDVSPIYLENLLQINSQYINNEEMIINHLLSGKNVIVRKYSDMLTWIIYEMDIPCCLNHKINRHFPCCFGFLNEFYDKV